MPSLVYFVILLYLHACTARPLMDLDKKAIAQAQGLKRMEPETYGGKISDATTFIQFENQRSPAVKETDQRIKGSFMVKLICSVKSLQEAADRKLWKRPERSTLESPASSKGEEAMYSKKHGTAEDVVVMDYEQPHRKPPIHNWEP